VSIGMLGVVTAQSLGAPFPQLIEQRLFPALGIAHSYIVVPPSEQPHYAQGYTSQGQPTRMKGDVLSDASYGVRATAADMLRFVEINLGLHDVEPSLHQAIVATRTGYYQAGAMTQDLIWEQYPYPAALPALLAGNAPTMIDVTPVTKIDPPLAPNDDTWVNKTGSTNGFGTYLAFLPSRHAGIVMLANRNYPISARVTAAYRILSALDGRD
jgi:beta-lactamase class C